MDSAMELLQIRLQSLRLTYSFPVLDAEWVCGISRSSINFWERGLRTPSADGILQIAFSYGVSIDWLFGLSDIKYISAPICRSESIYLIKEDLLQRALLDFSGNQQYAKELFSRYCSEVSNGEFSLQARADVIVSCLYLRGYDNYFAADSKRTPTLQQKGRMYNMKEGLFKILETKKPLNDLI